MLVEVLKGVTVRPTALAVEVMKFTPAREMLLVPLTWKGTLQLIPNVQVWELTVTAEFVRLELGTEPTDQTPDASCATAFQHVPTSH